METNTIYAKIAWCDKNYCAIADDTLDGAVIVTDRTFEGVKKAFAEALRFHIDGMISDGDDVPAWMADGQYEIAYRLDASAVLKNAQNYTTLSAISRKTGINERLLYQYANDMKRPRPAQRERIMSGIRSIGRELMSMS